MIADWPRRPDPAKGLLETIAVRDGKLIDAAAHLARLAGSAGALYGIHVAPELRPEIQLGRIRVVVSARGDISVDQREETPDPAPTILEPRALPHGLGPHKWADRPGEPHWLIVDGDDVLETAAANIWIEREGELITPPADGRILPGITRARLLSTRGREQRITLQELRAAEVIFLTSSIRLVTPAGLLQPASARAIRLAQALRDDPAISMKTRSYIR